VILAEDLRRTVLGAAATSSQMRSSLVETHDRRLGQRIEVQLKADDCS
jgi:hypothetical protein